MYEAFDAIGALFTSSARSACATLRDIQSGRLKLSPVSHENLHQLAELGLIELHDDEPELMEAGAAVLSD